MLVDVLLGVKSALLDGMTELGSLSGDAKVIAFVLLGVAVVFLLAEVWVTVR